MAIQDPIDTREFKKNLLESRQKFLSVLYNDEKTNEKNIHADSEKKKQRKISFKVKRNTSILNHHRRNVNSSIHKNILTVNKVSELTSKFNQIIEQQNGNYEEIKLQKLVKKLNSFKRCNNNTIITIKQKNPIVLNNEIIRKPSLKNKPLVYDRKVKILVKKGKEGKSETSLKLNLPKDKLVSKSSNDFKSAGFVQEFIKNFEKKEVEAKSVQKPPVPKKPSISPKRFSVDTQQSKITNKSSPPRPKSLPIKKISLPQIYNEESFNNFDSSSNDYEQTTPSNDLSTTILGFDLPSNSSHLTDYSIKQATDLKTNNNELVNNNSSFLHKNIPPIGNDEKLYQKNIAINRNDITNQNNKILFNNSVLYNKFNSPLLLKKDKVGDSNDAPDSCYSENTTPTIENTKDPNILYDERFTTVQIPLEKQFSTNIDTSLHSRSRSLPVSKSPLNSNDDDTLSKSIDLLSEKSNTNTNSTNDILSSSNTTEDKFYSVVSINEIDFSKYEGVKPNYSFLWNQASSNIYQPLMNNKFLNNPDIKKDTDVNLSQSSFLHERQSIRRQTLPLISKNKHLELYEELNDGYEPIGKPLEDYEPNKTISTENIYEVLPEIVKNKPLPDIPISNTNHCSKTEESISNCYESIYNSTNPGKSSNYEIIYFNGIRRDENRDETTSSIVSSDIHTNSIYERTWNENFYTGSNTSELASEISVSDKSDWVDLSENEEENRTIVIIQETPRSKKNTSWSQQCRQQWEKSSKLTANRNDAESDSDHHYETLQSSDHERNDNYDSFVSDFDSDDDFESLNNDHPSSPLPPVPNSNDVLTRLAATASKHMRKFTKNLSLTKTDISKSLTKITRRKSKGDLNFTGSRENNYENKESRTSLNNSDEKSDNLEDNDKNRSLGRGFLNRLRRSMIMSPEMANEITTNINNKSKSTFYITPTIDIDSPYQFDQTTNNPLLDNSSNSRLSRPLSPPPPTPSIVSDTGKDKTSPSWYAEVNLDKSVTPIKAAKISSTTWYEDLALYQKSPSTPSTSSAENSGTHTNMLITELSKKLNMSDSEQYYNLRNNESNNFDSLNSNDMKTDASINSLSGDDIQLRLQNEPLYQFYDAAISESLYHDSMSDSENYEDMENRSRPNSRSLSRPSAMDLIIPKRNSLAITRTLWCEVPEVVHSTVLSTLSTHQKKLQEAKFEMVTSEASYLNSLNVLNEHFFNNLKNAKAINEEEADLLFGKIEHVRQSSNRLLVDLEKCWQENILLHGVCEIIQKHAEESFSVYIPYCENHMLLDPMMKKLRERPLFNETLKQLESSPICQCLSLYSFLMLPMQRITRWPLLIDAVLKRLEQGDPEYLTCQYTLATINKIVNECNEGARMKERELEMKKLVNQMEFAKGVTPINLPISNRYLVRYGSVNHVQPKSEEIKLTFGKKFTKVMLNLFLFNDLLLVTKQKGDHFYSILHYCSRNFIEINTSEAIASVPVKEMPGKYLFFLTILENQDKKTVELMLSCSSESDKQRWIEALTPPKSDNPDEVLYECWDCPQVTAIHNYIAVQPDELALTKGDVINVLRKMADGWYHGERLRDSQTGWFPANHTTEIMNPHVRARNLKQRYRLLAFSQNYLKNV